MRNLEQGHLTPLDGIRGLAILMVVCSHVFGGNSDAGAPIVRILGDILNYGAFGVDIFFVLSGFLITGILLDSAGLPGFFKNFYARRVLRIFPLYYGVLFLLLACTPLLHLHWDSMGWLMLGYLQNLRPLEIVTFSPGARLNLNHLWSLAVEEQFYLAWPVVIFFVRGRRRLFMTTLLLSLGTLLLRIVLVHRGFGTEMIHVSTFTRADSLLIGGSLALLFRSKYWSQVLAFAPWGLVAATTVLFISIHLLSNEFSPATSFSRTMRFWIDGPRYTILALGAACLLACSLRPGSVGEWIFERNWLRFLGKYSYGIYLLHMIPLALLVGGQRRILLHLTHSKLLAIAGAGFSTFACAVLAAYICFHLYEKPFLRLKHYFDRDSAPALPLLEVHAESFIEQSLVNS